MADIKVKEKNGKIEFKYKGRSWVTDSVTELGRRVSDQISDFFSNSKKDPAYLREVQPNEVKKANKDKDKDKDKKK